jgi:hypothetical protein
MATQKQQLAFKKMLKNMEEGCPKSLGLILTESGYGKICLQPSRIINSQGFQQLLAKIDDSQILNKWYEWALSEEDRRVSMEAGKEIMKLKDRYPAGKLKITQFEEELKKYDE